MRDTGRVARSTRQGLGRWLAPMGAVWLLLFLLGGCSTTVKEVKAPEPPLHYVHKDGFDLTWRELRDGSDLVFYGVVRNNSDIFVQNLLLTVNLIDDKGDLVDRQAFPEFPVILHRHESAPFRLKFSCPVERSEERVFLELDYSLTNWIGPNYNVYQVLCTADESRSR